MDTEQIHSFTVKFYCKYLLCLCHVTIKVADVAWCNTYTRLLLRLKNRNYKLFKKYNCDYQNVVNQPKHLPEIATRLLNTNNKAWIKASEAAVEFSKANHLTKNAFNNTVNNTLKNPSISAKKNFQFC